ncbi:MAG: penicillin-binding protein, partial [Polaribacter sp.]
MATHKKSILTKFYIVASFMTLFLFAIIFRVINIQYFQGEKYKKLATELTIKQDTVYANKGNVYAADGNLLATSMSKFTIRVDLLAIDATVFEKNVANLAKELGAMFGKSKNYYEAKLRVARKQKNRYFLIARNVGYNDYLKLKQFPIFKLGVYRGGFIAEHKTVRAHPIGKIAERTIGYDDFRGEAGIEGAFADFMQGENGLRWKQKIA